MTTGQDQPGNYCPKRPEAPFKASLPTPLRVPSLGWSSSMNSQKEFLKGKATTAGLPSAPESVQTSPNRPWSDHLVPPISQSSSATSPCLQRDRDHGLRWGLPATGYAFFERCAAVTADPRVVIWLTRFGHRQAIHILLSLQALITKVRSSTRQTKSGPVPFPKSAYPE